MNIFLARDNNQGGPFSPEQLQEMIHSGTVMKTDMVWHDGMPGWRCIGMVPEYLSLFEASSTTVGHSAQGTPESKTDVAPASAAAKAAPASTTAASSGDAAPIPYNPNGAPPPKADGPAVTGFSANERELASRGARLMASLLDGVICILAVWILSAYFLPGGLSLMDLAGTGGHQGPRELVVVENEVGEKTWEIKPVDGSAALSIADRYNRNELTEAEQAKILHFLMAVGIVILVILILQVVFLCTKGQSIGKMFLGIRIARDPSMAPAKFVHAVLLRSVVPWIINMIPIIGGLFSIVNVLCIFGADKKCLHDRIASTAVVKA
ncbi:MAG: RDD family protein [Verrucomicrobiales bacterium]